MGGSPTSTTAWSIILLSPIKWNVSVLDHVLDLPSHGNGEKNAEIHQKNRPKDRYIKDAKEAAYNGNHCSLGSRVPEDNVSNNESLISFSKHTKT